MSHIRKRVYAVLSGIPLISIFLFGLSAVLAYLFIFGFIWGAGYYPTPAKEIDNAGELLEPNKGSEIYDLGCGFGKVIFRLARKYPEAKFIGVDVDPLKYVWCQIALRVNHLGGRVTFLRKNLLDVDLSNATGIFVFLSEETSIMEHLKEKIFRETSPNTRIASYIHGFKSWEPSEERGGVALYIVTQKEAQD